ncbi:MAG: DUF2232 domain-containing protein, partial [Pseudomonadota bacterium]
MNPGLWGRLFLTSILGLGLSHAFGFFFLAALPMRYSRLTFGRMPYLLSSLVCASLLISYSLFEWAAIYCTLSFLIGFYRELEEKKLPILTSSTISVLTTAGLTLGAVVAYAAGLGTSLQSFLLGRIEPALEQLKEFPRFAEMTSSQVLWYMPSGLIISLMLILFVSLSLNRGNSGHQQLRKSLQQFRLPESMIWLFIASLAGTYIRWPEAWGTIPLVSMNVLAITMAAYFFQGLAVFNHFLNRLRVYGFWRLFAYFLVFLQMFPFVSE